MRLIDADAIEYTYTTARGTEDGHNWRVFAVGEDEIDGMPTIDAVPVVRCRECAVPHNKWTGCPKLGGLVTPPDWYCAFGERKDKT